MIGARDMAFPVLNMVSFWIALPAAIIMLEGFFVPGGMPRRAGPPMRRCPPLRCIRRSTEGATVVVHQPYYSGVLLHPGGDQLHHHRNQYGRPGMTFFRLPLVFGPCSSWRSWCCWRCPCSSQRLHAAIRPTLRRTFSCCGGVVSLSQQHLFWFFGHPGGVHLDPSSDGHCVGRHRPPSPASRSSAIARWCTPSSASASCSGSSGVTTCSRAA